MAKNQVYASKKGATPRRENPHYTAEKRGIPVSSFGENEVFSKAKRKSAQQSVNSRIKIAIKGVFANLSLHIVAVTKK